MFLSSDAFSIAQRISSRPIVVISLPVRADKISSPPRSFIWPWRLRTRTLFPETLVSEEDDNTEPMTLKNKKAIIRPTARNTPKTVATIFFRKSFIKDMYFLY